VLELDPESLSDIRIRCSAGLLGIVLRNIVGNALKYVAGRSLRVVRVSVKTMDAGFVAIAVSDSGPGIPAEALPRIFEPFYRVPGTTKPGTGIGLATVDRIVRAHGGWVSVRSALGAGSIFELHLPVATPQPCLAPPRSAAEAVPQT
jgi:signal transduction histidine kinase